MSEYHEVELEVNDEKSIVQALEELGYKPIVTTQPVQLEGYMGDRRSQRAHIVLPRNQVGGASNDIGFEKVGNKYKMHISEYDIGANRFNDKEFKKLYNKNLVINKLKKSKKFKKKSISVDDKSGKIVIKVKRR